MQARKRFGQNFLTDATFIEKIIAALRLTPADHILEVGPGRGALTGRLLHSGALVEAVEIDRDLAALLKETFASSERFTLHIQDALQFDLASIASTQKLRVIGNLPYNISTPLLFHFLQQRSVVRDMYFMLQSEVVERIVAPPGSKTYGRLSVMLQYYFHVARLFNVPAGAFEPRPKVMSAVISLLPRVRTSSEAVEYVALESVVRAAFQQRRKTIKNNLHNFFTASALLQLDIDPRQRAETLSVEQFVQLAQALPSEPL